MTALVIAIFTASLLGSLHCAGMCGAFVAIAVNGGASKTATQSAYHGGRLITYLALGTVAGLLGSLVDMAAYLGGLQPVAAILAGATMIGFAAVALLRLHGARIPKLPLPKAMQEMLIAGHRRAMNRGPIVRAGLIGLLTTLLPCGWLYAFVITAAGTARPELGALAMFVFWLGTLPVLVAIGTGVQTLFGSLGKRLPTVTCVIVLVAGIWTLLGRSGLSSVAMAKALTPTTAPTTVPSTTQPMPCCHGK
jgi:hypothetical protein